jgi:hypothetical protein
MLKPGDIGAIFYAIWILATHELDSRIMDPMALAFHRRCTNYSTHIDLHRNESGSMYVESRSHWVQEVTGRPSLAIDMNERCPRHLVTPASDRSSVDSRLSISTPIARRRSPRSGIRWRNFLFTRVPDWRRSRSTALTSYSLRPRRVSCPSNLNWHSGIRIRIPGSELPYRGP